METNIADARTSTRSGRNVVSFIIILILLLSAVSAAAYYRFTSLLTPVSGPGQAVAKVITVPPGANPVQIGNLLESKGLIKNGTAFRFYAKLSGLDNRLQAGEFKLNSGLSTPEIIERIAKGDTYKLVFTIPEGYTLKQIADKLAEKKLVNRDRFLNLAANGNFNYSFLRGLPNGRNRLEGYLFPDTYQIADKTTEEKIINMMLTRFAKESADVNLEAMAAKQGLTVKEAVTLASIIEREAQKDEERPKVAAVFLNRLKKGWRLESCATIQYILGEPKARLLAKDLQIESPYNTYKYSGLPPGPISSPGGPSLRAAVNPADVDYFFFVVAEDGNHIFSRTLKEHNRNKAVYLDRLKTAQ